MHKENDYDWANKSPQELKDLSREEIHENYKKIIKLMLFEFYVHASNRFDDDITVKMLNDYIHHWVEGRFMPAREDWNPNDN